MTTAHPSWCRGTEPPCEDHVSKTFQASEPTDNADIKIRIEELQDTHEHRRIPLVFLQFTEDDQTEVYPLLLPQAKRLVGTLSRLLAQVEPAIG